MIVKRFYEEKLAQASFLVGCSKTGAAAVIDPNRDVDQYVQAAEAEGLQITVVTETHIHADFVSGSRELADHTGARLYLSDEGDADWKYAFASQPNVILIRDGDKIRIGNVRLDVMSSPGHTPEHVAFILTDEPATPDPLGAFTGDFIFVGDVGRPDLLERAAGLKGTMEKGAHVLYDSLAKFKSLLPDTLLIWPSHGSGSACGKSLGGVPVTTLGYERKANWGVRCQSVDEFTRVVLDGQPDPPRYFKEMKRINKAGPPILGGFKSPSLLGGALISELLARGEVIVDIRSAAEAATGFIPGVFNIPLDRSFPNWAGWLLPYDRPIFILASEEREVRQAVHDLHLVGLDDIPGWLGSDAFRAYAERNGPLETVPQISAAEAYLRFEGGEFALVDVRSPGEYSEGHIPGAPNVPLGHLQSRLNELPRDRPLVVYCEGGFRSPIGVSVLRRHGFDHSVNMTGGFSEYGGAGLPIA